MLRSVLRQALAGLGRVVAEDDLFEKPDERPPSPPLPASPPVRAAAPWVAEAVPEAPAAAAPVAAPAVEAPPAGEAAPTRAKARKKANRAAGSFQRPTEGCVPVDGASLPAALTPAGKPLVVNHWATWCDPCVDELPRLVRAMAGVAGVGEFVGLSWDLFDHPGDPDEVAKKVAAFADNAGVGYPSLLFTGEPEELFRLCGLDLHLVPQTLVIAPDGKVAWHKKGVIDHDDVFPLIRAVKAAAGVPT